MIRLDSIEIRNFKNVGYGSFSFRNGDGFQNGSVLGIYGQNGSGKTALIEALQLLKYVLCGISVPERYAQMINVNEEYSSFTFKFCSEDERLKEGILYSFNLCKSEESPSHNVSFISDEILKMCIISTTRRKSWKNVINASELDDFKLIRRTFGNSKKSNFVTDIIVSRKLAREQSKSFVFSSDFLKCFERYPFFPDIDVVFSLQEFGLHHLFVIRNEITGIINLHAGMPFSFYLDQDEAKKSGSILIPFDSSVCVPAEIVDIAEKTVSTLNIVLPEIVPDLTILVNRISEGLDRDGNRVVSIVLMSKKNGKDIPLEYESEGIKRIISILSLLIVCYNNPSIVLAVDELDSGIFEYLLGEILKVFSTGAKGQFVFTSHNLRALEVLNPKDIIFTTSNFNNRYVHMKYVKTTNNLRDMYYREILIHEQDESLYETTYKSDIEHAFRKAGDI